MDGFGYTEPDQPGYEETVGAEDGEEGVSNKGKEVVYVCRC